MVVFNIANWISLILLTVFTILVVYLGRETKKSAIPGTLLIAYLVLLVIYVIQFMLVKGEDPEMTRIISNCLVVNFGFIFITFLGYLWADELEAKVKKKKVVKSGIEWLWKKI